MKKMSKKIKTIIVLLLILLISLAACGRNRDEAEADNGEQGSASGTAHGTIARSPYAEVLTIFVPAMHQNLFNRAARRFQEEATLQGREIFVDVATYMHHERDEHYAQLLSRFAAGEGPDIVILNFAPVYQFIENGFLADINTLIPNHDEFFANVLTGMEIGGRLYTFPMEFGFNFIGINARMPHSVIESFAALEMVTASDLMRIYAELIENYPEFAGYAMSSGFHWSQSLIQEIIHRVDFANRTADFAVPEIIEYMETMRENFPDDIRVQWEQGRTDAELMEERAKNYVFNTGRDIEALFEFQEPLFVHYIPIANERGQLVNSLTWSANVSVSSTASPELAWEFIEILLSESATDESTISIDAPITRRYFRDALEGGVRRILDFGRLDESPRPLADPVHIAAEAAVNRMAVYSEKPISTMVLRLPINWELLMQFNEGEITAYEATAQIQAELIAWMNEEREIAEFIPEQQEYTTDLEALGLPARTITILAENRHSYVIEQAAGAMNAAWRERNEPYIFRVDIEGYTTQGDGWQERQNRFQRLQIEMMAGDGPDMFIINTQDKLYFPNPALLHDFYSLIDNCPTLSLDDFFTQPLRAFERSGQLSFFPVSFGLMYVGVNTGLPQPFIDRFARQSSLSVIELMDFITDLTDAHGDDFPQFTEFNIGTFSISTWSLFNSVMGGFIDFENRVSNLDDPQFAEFLRAHSEFTRVRQSPSRMYMFNVLSQERLHLNARNQILNVEHRALNPINAFFSHEAPYFDHHIPLAYHNGRLLINSDGVRNETWAIVCISARADGALAWEFTQPLIHAYTNPEGRAAFTEWGSPAEWGSNSLATPISRSLFEPHTRRGFYEAFNYLDQSRATQFPGAESPAERSRMIDSAINRMLAYYEMPMGLLSPNIPWELFSEARMQFESGVITAEAAAQRMHNSIALWLIE
jgi:ABC-type glycerol-3-phosphate transport system substrate-binding protein